MKHNIRQERVGNFMSFQTTIRELRERAGLSQQDVADAIGIARATYASLEVDRRPPNLDEMRALAEYYQIAPSDLIDGTVSMVNEPVAQYTSQTNEDEVIPREDVTLDRQKLRQVLLYISGQVGARPNVGATVINKLLYFIDFDYYEQYGKSITGLSYIRNHYGPTAHMPTITSTVQQMRADGQLEVVETPYFKHTQKKYLPLKSADLTELNAQELAHIDAELEKLGSKSANELSDLSHLDMPWMATKPGDVIDYQLAMYRTAATTTRGKDDVEL